MSRRVLIGFIIAAILTTGLLVLYFLDQQIPRDPSDVGNSAGNLHNGGYFFEMDGKVYFANPADSYCLYSMDLDESNPKRLTSMGVKYISGANGYLYFYMDSTHKAAQVKGLGSATNQYGIYRCKVNGRDQVCLLRDFCGECQLCGEYIYYQGKLDGGTLNRIRVDKQDKSVVAPEAISPVCYYDGVIYYTGVSSDHHIHALNTKANYATYDVLYGNYFFPVINGYYMYYLNGDDNYSICRTNMVNGSSEVVTKDRADCFTMNDSYIYYCYSDGLLSQLRRCDIDGGNTVILFQGVVNELNLTSRYLYFKVYGNDTVLYHIPLDGSAPASAVNIKMK